MQYRLRLTKATRTLARYVAVSRRSEPPPDIVDEKQRAPYALSFSLSSSPPWGNWSVRIV